MQKLNDFVNPELQEEGIAFKRYLKNSIKRNIIFPSINMVNQQAISEYQTKLTRHNFQQNDLYLLFQHLYSKDEMSVSDRNLIRRILLTIFPEALISSGGKKLVSCSKYLCLNKGQKFNGEDKLYLIMKGTVKVNSPFYQKTLSKGMYFGHLELQTYMHSNSFIVTVQSDATSMLSITAECFHSSITKYFSSIYNEKLAIIPKCITDKLQPIQIYLLCEEMQKKIFTIGNKINKKGDLINQIIFVEESKINENIDVQSNFKKMKVPNAIGLGQIIQGTNYYAQDNFTLEETKAYCVPIKKFMKIAEKDLVSNLKGQSRISHSILQRTQRRHKTDTSPVQKSKIQIQTNPLKKFIKIKKVNLPYSKLKSPQSQNTSTEVSKLSCHKYQASFIFLNTNQLQTPQINKQGRVNRSFSLVKQQKSSCQMQKYLDNIQIPSLAKFNTSESLII